jgi:uncharacterized protein YjbJ (UPF0337 family)
VGRLRLYSAPRREEGFVSFWDKLMGRGKKAAGDVTDAESLRREGAHQEAEGVAEDRAESAEETAQAAREEAAEHRAERDN